MIAKNRLLRSVTIAMASSAGLTITIDQWRVYSIRREAATAGLRSDWNTVNLALRMGTYSPTLTRVSGVQDDPSLLRLINRVSGIYMLADEQGRPLQWSRLYQDLGDIPCCPAAPQPHFSRVKSKSIFGGTYLLCTAPIYFPGGHIYWLTVARAI